MQRRTALRRSILWIAIGSAIALASLGVLIVTVAGESGEGALRGAKATPGAYPRGVQIPAPQLALPRAAEAAGCRLVRPPNEGDAHVGSPVRYRANPPTSGDHHREPAADGVYATAPAPEATVHSLEHGRVFIQFRPDASQQVRGQLFTLFEEDDHHLLLAPNPTGVRWEVAATAWEHALLCPELNARVFDAIRSFRDRYRDRGPELVP